MTVAAILGVPSVFSTFVFDAARALVTITRGFSGVVLFDRKDRIEDKLPDDGKARVILANFGGPSLVDSQRIERGLLVVDDPLEAMRFSRQQGVAFTSAIRAHGQSFALLADARRSRHWPVVDRRSCPQPLGTFLAYLAHALELDITSLQIEKSLDYLQIRHLIDQSLESALEHRVPGYAPLGFYDSELAENEVQLTDMVLRGLAEGIVAPDLSSSGGLNWPRELFFNGDDPHNPPPLVVDITGGARCLLFGPYLFLPRGSWLAHLVLGFSEDALNMPFRIEAYSAGSVLGVVWARPTQAGIFSASIPFGVTQNDEPIELRVLSEEGAIEGRIGMVRADLEPAPGDGSQPVQCA